MDEPEVNPEKAPSGARATGYGEIMVRVWITGEDGDKTDVEAMILADPEMPQIYMEAVAQHALAAAAATTDMDFDKAIDEIAKNAKTAHSRLFRRRRTE